MSGHIFAAETGGKVATVDLSGGNITFVYIVLAIAVIALVLGAMFRSQVLAAGEGTDQHADDRAGGPGRRQRLPQPAVPHPRRLRRGRPSCCCSCCPRTAASDVRIGRSVFFLVGAGFSALIGYLGMWLAVRANVRVAAAARDEGRDPAMRVAFRTGGTVGMATVGLGLLGAALVVLIYKGDAPDRARGLRLRRRAARHVHAGRRRHLHQGRRRRRRPGRQGRAEHPRGRPAQRRDHRRQRRRQRRRLRRHGRRPVRVLRRDAGGRADPRQGRLRRRGPGLPADRAGHRRAHRDPRRLPHQPAPGRERPDHDQPLVLHLGRRLRGAVHDRRVRLPAGVVRRAHRRTAGAVRPTTATRASSPPSRCSSASCWPRSSWR